MLNPIRDKRLKAKIPIDVLSAVTGVPASTLSLQDRGTKDLSLDRFRLVDSMLNELLEMVEFYAPVPIAWSDVSAIRELLDQMRRAKRHPDAWQLLRELGSSDPDAVCSRYGWSQDELLNHLTTARQQLEALTTSLQSQPSA